jgi:hypothetical protein
VVRAFGQEHPFTISAEEFEDNGKLLAAIRVAAGPRPVLRAKPAVLRQAILEASYQQYHVPCREVTTDFGWDQDLAAYRAPSGLITAAGVAPAGLGRRVDLSEGPAGITRNLDMAPLPPELLLATRQHVAQDFLGVHSRRVTYPLLGAVACTVLQRFAPPELCRFVLWLKGLTGSGKSFAAKLAQNFFGDFQSRPGDYATWGSTPYFLQMLGYYFRDALFLVDDFKPMALRPGQLQQITWLLQTYSDSTARGRLNADSSAKPLRPIRGMLVSTGEDVPEHSASTTARSVIVEVPNQGKDIGRGHRCLERCRHYPGVTADLIRWLLATGRAAGFAARARARKQHYLQGIEGRQNADRIAGNFGLLAAGFEEVAMYLADVWPQQQQETHWFVEEELVAVRDGMAAEAREQQESEVFLAVLGDLLAQKAVCLLNSAGTVVSEGKPHVGREIQHGRIQVNTNLALGQVNDLLRRQGRPPLQVTSRTLLRQLQQDGRLLGQDGQPLPAQQPPTEAVHLGGQVLRCFTIRKASLYPQ